MTRAAYRRGTKVANPEGRQHGLTRFGAGSIPDWRVHGLLVLIAHYRYRGAHRLWWPADFHDPPVGTVFYQTPPPHGRWYFYEHVDGGRWRVVGASL